MKILVVDDTEANRRLLGWMLEDEGHTVQEAENGELAVALFKETNPDLVLMDVMMPIMDGFEATKAIKEYLGGKHVPIIFLTALSDDASLAKCLSIGGDDFLSKPINEQVLQAKIKAHSRIKDLNEQLNEQNAKLTKMHQLTEHEHKIAKTVFEAEQARMCAAAVFGQARQTHIHDQGSAALLNFLVSRMRQRFHGTPARARMHQGCMANIRVALLSTVKLAEGTIAMAEEFNGRRQTVNGML